jgi:uncharacterized protein with PIN domain
MKDFSEIFSLAREEQRVLLTNSKQMLLRSACPESFLIDPRNNEKSLIELFSKYKIPLDKEKFLTVCGKCGGQIIIIQGEKYQEMWRERKGMERIEGSEKEENHNVPWVPTDREVFMCDVCFQVHLLPPLQTLCNDISYSSLIYII